MNDIIPFTFPETGQPVRTVTIDGELWWLSRDVADILELGNIHSSLALLDEDEKGIHSVETLGGPQQAAVINEPGLYSLILRSRKPQAKAFKRWITHEVIPSIRQTGRYEVPSLADPLAELERQTNLTARAIEIAKAERAGREVAEQQVRELEPVARSWQVLASGEGDFSVADAAKILGRDPSITLGRNRLFAVLAEHRWTYRQGADDKPRAMQTAVTRGWLSELPQSYEHPRTGELVLAAPQVRVTLKGLHELHKRLGGTGAVVVPASVQGGAR